MDSADVGDRRLMDKQQKRRVAFLLLVACIVAVVLRIAVAYHGGIWADEGFFLLVAGAPSWQAMIDFLRFHESHPPFFYALMRVWMALTGSSDTAALILPIAIGIAIMPAIFVCGSRLFCRRAGIIAALLAAISPALVEFSTQLRPYGLLPLLALLSCWSLAEGIARGRMRWWIVYTVTTLLMVYTHNWSWLVLVGEMVAVFTVMRAGLVAARAVRGLVISLTLAAVGFLPWATTLIFQMRHAGHAPMAIHGWSQILELVWFALPSAFAMTLFGTLSNAGAVMIVAALGCAIAAAVVVRARDRIEDRWLESPSKYRGNGPSDDLQKTGMLLFLVTPIATIVAAVALSPRTDLLLPRCLATVSPLLVLSFAGWIDRSELIESRGQRSPLVAATLAGVVTISVFGIISLLQTTRSNVREVASALIREISPDDLIVVVPEWYAASLNHYFHEPVEQIDYPHPGMSGMVDFANVFDRVADPGPPAALTSRVHDARLAGRRVWLITGRSYLRPVSSVDSIDAFRYRKFPVISALRVQQISADLEMEFGPPDTTAFVGGWRPRYDEILPLLYSPKVRAPVSADSAGAK